MSKKQPSKPAPKMALVRSSAAINQRIKRIFHDNEEAESSVVQQYLITAASIRPLAQIIAEKSSI